MSSISRMVGVTGVALLALSCSRGAAETSTGEVDAIPVRVAEVQTDSITLPVIATGTLGSDEEVTFAFKVGGIVASVNVNPGDRVRAGQTLATLDTREIDAAVSRAQAAAEKAARDAARAKRLFEGGVIPRRQMDDALTAERVAQADLTTAEFNRSFSVIVAPSSGVVLERNAEAGELVAAGASILEVASGTRGYVLRVGLADRDVVRVRRGDAALVRFDAFPNEAFAGRVSEMGSAADYRTGTYSVEIALERDPRFITGLIGSVEIAAASGGQHPVVPVEALLEADGDRGTIFVLRPDSTAERRSVRLAPIPNGRVAILDGLDGAQTVVTAGAAYLREGSRVEVRP